MSEAGRIADELAPERLRPPGGTDAESYAAHLRIYNGALDLLLAMLAVVAFHGRDGQTENIARVLRRIARTAAGSGLTLWLNLQPYPALLIAYTVGVLSLATRQYRHLAAALLTSLRNPYKAEDEAMVLHVAPARVLQGTQLLPGYERRHTPASDFVASQLGPLLAEYLPQDEFLDAFDTFEFLLSLVHMDQDPLHRPAGGSFVWRRRGTMANMSAAPIRNLEQELRVEIAEPQGGPILRAGFFGGQGERLSSALEQHSEWISRAAAQMF